MIHNVVPRAAVIAAALFFGASLVILIAFTRF
jgi:hypothetical protein